LERTVFDGKPEADALPDGAAGKFVRSQGFFRTIPVMPGAQNAMQQLMKHFEVYIVSAAMEFPLSLSEKYEWIREHFPFIEWRHIIFCGDKSVIDTDYMIDDHIRNLDCCKGKTILFTAGHNLGIDRHMRVNNWDDILTFLQKELQTV